MLVIKERGGHYSPLRGNVANALLRRKVVIPSLSTERWPCFPSKERGSHTLLRREVVIPYFSRERPAIHSKQTGGSLSVERGGHPFFLK